MSSQSITDSAVAAPAAPAASAGRTKSADLGLPPNFPQLPNLTVKQRTVRSCTNCRQQKIKCNATDTFPNPCTTCAKRGKTCEVDPLFKPVRTGHNQLLREDLSRFRSLVRKLISREKFVFAALAQSHAELAAQIQAELAAGETALTAAESELLATKLEDGTEDSAAGSDGSARSDSHSAQKQRESQDRSDRSERSDGLLPGLKRESEVPNAELQTFPTRASAAPPGDSLAETLRHTTAARVEVPISLTVAQPSSATATSPVYKLQKPSESQHSVSFPLQPSATSGRSDATASATSSATVSATAPTSATPSATPSATATFRLGHVVLTTAQAELLHKRFLTQYLPYFPILTSASAAELHSQSPLLFWTAMLTAALSEPDPGLYNSLALLIKQLAIETCWITTPRSTHIVQALLILSMWPLPNQKVLDDCSYRFTGLAKSLALQLGLHRGEFMEEFSRKQATFPDAEKWRTVCWAGVFFSDQFWSSILGLPPSVPVDNLVEGVQSDCDIPVLFRSLVRLAGFHSKLFEVMGSNVGSPTGLMEAKTRSSALGVMERQLDQLRADIDFSDPVVDLFYHYVRLVLCCFAFFPETPVEDQLKFVPQAYDAALTVAKKFLDICAQNEGSRQVVEYPVYIRQAVSFAALVLFRLYASSFFLSHEEARSAAMRVLMKVYYVFKAQINSLTAAAPPAGGGDAPGASSLVWNDITRQTKLWEKVNLAYTNHPEIFVDTGRVVIKMASHLTASLFYELIWYCHEARKRDEKAAKQAEGGGQLSPASESSRTSGRSEDSVSQNETTESRKRRKLIHPKLPTKPREAHYPPPFPLDGTASFIEPHPARHVPPDGGLAALPPLDSTEAAQTILSLANSRAASGTNLAGMADSVGSVGAAYAPFMNMGVSAGSEEVVGSLTTHLTSFPGRKLLNSAGGTRVGSPGVNQGSGAEMLSDEASLQRLITGGDFFGNGDAVGQENYGIDDFLGWYDMDMIRNF